MRLLSLNAVLEKVGVSRSTWLRLVAAGHAPVPKKISPRRVGWLETEVDGFIGSRL